MAKIGLTGKLSKNLELSWKSHNILHNSPIAKSRNMALQETFAILKEIKDTKDIKLSLSVEATLLDQELSLYANSSE